MKAAHGRVVSLHYTLTDDLGVVLDSSRGHGPFAYLHGYGNIIRGLENALEGNEAGFNGAIEVLPADAYGEYNPQAVFEVPREQFPPGEDIKAGMQVQGEGPHGVLNFTVVDVSDQRGAGCQPPDGRQNPEFPGRGAGGTGCDGAGTLSWPRPSPRSRSLKVGHDAWVGAMFPRAGWRVE